MRSAILLLTFLINGLIFSQENNLKPLYINFIGVDKINKENSNEKEKWFLLADKSDYKMYIIKYDNTPIGLKHMIEELKKILEFYDLKLDNPEIENSLIPSYINGINDYSNLNDAISVGYAEVKKIWRIFSFSIISLEASKNDYDIRVAIEK